MWLPFHHLISLTSQSASDKIENTDDWVLHGWKRARNWTKRKLQCTTFYNHVGREVASNWQLENAESTYAMPSFAATIRTDLMWIHFKICDAWKHAPLEPYHPWSCLHPYISISLCLTMCIYIYREREREHVYRCISCIRICLITGMLHWLRRVHKLD